MFCELPITLITDKNNLYNIVEIINKIHLSNHLLYDFNILFICYDTDK